jgi:uncharacterized protein (TIGR03083 family)
MSYRRTYRAAAVSFADLVSRLPGDLWYAPGLGDWTLRELVGHTVSSALRQVPAVLGTPAASVEVETAEGYFAYARSVPDEMFAGATAASSEDARTTAAWLGANPVAAVNDLAGRATAALSAVGDDDVITTAAGGMRVRDWLPTRTFELVVHGLDAAAAAGVEYGLSLDVIAESTAMAARLAVALGNGPSVLRALTGRAPLPEKFTVV